MIFMDLVRKSYIETYERTIRDMVDIDYDKEKEIREQILFYDYLMEKYPNKPIYKSLSDSTKNLYKIFFGSLTFGVFEKFEGILFDNYKKKAKIGIEFVSYDGEYPNLCSGTLVLKIDGHEVTFPKYCMNSGGSISGDYWNVYEGEWTVKVPEEYKVYEKEINKVVNENVEHGCCGGCI